MSIARLLVAFLALAFLTGQVYGDPRDPPSYKDKLLSSTQPFKAKVTAVNTANHTLTIEVKHKGTERDPQRATDIANLQQQIVVARRLRDAATTNRLQTELYNLQSSPYKQITENIDLQPDDSTKIRSQQLPQVYNDQGKPRRLTERERRELKGSNSSLPGYAADFSSLKTGQSVEIKMAKKNRDQDSGRAAPKVAQILIASEPSK